MKNRINSDNNCSNIEHPEKVEEYKIVRDKVINLINTVLKNRGKRVTTGISLDKSLRTEVSFDSLDFAELTVRIEAEYDIDIFEDGIVDSINEIIEKLL